MPTEDQPASDRLYSLLDEHWAFSMAEAPELATRAGYQGHNRRWTDLSIEAIDSRKRKNVSFQRSLQQIDVSSLRGEDRLNYVLFEHHLQNAVEAADHPSEYLQVGPMGGPPSAMAQTIALMPSQTASDLEDIVTRIDAVPGHIDQVIGLLEEGARQGVTQPSVVLRNAVQLVEAHVVDRPEDSPLFVPFSRSGAADDLVDEAKRAVAERAIPAFRKLSAFLADSYVPSARTSEGWGSLPGGEEWYLHLVRRYTTTEMTPEQIHDTGISEVARIRAEMDEVIAGSGFSGSFDEFCAFLREDERFYFDDPAELLMTYRDIAKRADPELAPLFGRLPRLPYGVIPVPSYIEKTTTTAYYQPGSPEAGRPGYFFANTYDLRSRPKWEMEALTLHEAVPGHHLQITLAQEMPGVPEFRKHSLLTAYIEGWGLYSESLGREMGFFTDPYSRFGQLTYQMWRAVRLVVDTGIHAMGWSRDRAIAFFKQNSSKPDHDIVVEIDRYISWPGQALAYKIGELKISELRREAERVLGSGFDIRAFHDELLGAGALPLDILQRRMSDWMRPAGA